MFSIEIYDSKTSGKFKRTFKHGGIIIFRMKLLSMNVLLPCSSLHSLISLIPCDFLDSVSQEDIYANMSILNETISDVGRFFLGLFGSELWVVSICLKTILSRSKEGPKDSVMGSFLLKLWILLMVKKAPHSFLTVLNILVSAQL